MSWKEKHKYDKEDVKYIFEQGLKWHMSTFNAKSSAVPEEWSPLVDDWLKKMGYRYVLRKFTYPSWVQPHGRIAFTSWWENKGVAPIYKKFLLAIRLKNEKKSAIMISNADITAWLPGDNVYDNDIFVPLDMPSGEYDLQVGIIDHQSHKPRVKLAMEGIDPEGWYTIGKMKIIEAKY